MGGRERAIKTVQLSEAKDAISHAIDEVRQDNTRVLVEENGVPVAAIISAADLERFILYERQRAERFKVLDEIREAFKDVPDEEIERETDRIVARIRAESRHRALQSATS
jgi:prevent-host-death family protein